ncbi:DNA phosphorothioation-dependent restriction protein DptF [Sporomusa termitida]|uniref:DNA phosphorothioation-dependent restriction protein DptF n=1 Tax=Sporomusa termitida TaxID=2377 RepID=A0A517DWR4_9FIRM|nr:DNA phosphorothioation-dependent restriction protein DptF [Sporomusa termitida]
MESSKEAVENLASFSNFKKYIHVQRQVELELLSILEIAANSSIPQLILVCGGVGDGKSHLISYMFQKYPVLLNNFQKHNDATESFEPNKTSIDTLNDVLNAFSDEHLDEGKPEKLILAINLGALNNFIDSEKYRDHFTKLRRYVNDKKILETTILNNSYDKDEFFQFINFSDYHMFTLNNTGPKSSYIYELIYKISNQNNNNPFYNTYVENCCSCMIQDKCPVKANYEFFMDQDVIEQITQLLIETMIKQKLIISTRSLLNFIFEAIVCNQLKSVHITEYKEILSKFSFSEYIRSLTPNILF